MSSAQDDSYGVERMYLLTYNQCRRLLEPSGFALTSLVGNCSTPIDIWLGF